MHKLGSPKDDNNGARLMERADLKNFILLNNKIPTHDNRLGGKDSVLDLTFITPRLAIKTNFQVLNDAMGSDHHPILLTINDFHQPDINTGRKPFNIKHINWDSFRLHSSLEITDSHCHSADVDEFNGKFVEALLKTAQSSASHNRRSGNKRKQHSLPYWSADISAALRNRNKARNKRARNKTVENLLNYRQARAYAQRLIRKSAKEYWQNYCTSLNEKTNIKKVWNTVKKLKGVSTSSSSAALKINGVIVTDPAARAEVFVDHFASVTDDSHYQEPFVSFKPAMEALVRPVRTAQAQKDTHPELNAPFSFDELEFALRRSPSHSAPGEDGISYELLKSLSVTSKQTLLKLYNLVWVNRKTPLAWRKVLVCPFLKPDKDGFDPSSYRPISLTSSTGKVLEKMVTRRLNWHLEKNHLYPIASRAFDSGDRSKITLLN